MYFFLITFYIWNSQWQIKKVTAFKYHRHLSVYVFSFTDGFVQVSFMLIMDAKECHCFTEGIFTNKKQPVSEACKTVDLSFTATKQSMNIL